MFSVPRVTMNGGNCTRVIRPPLTAPKAVQTLTPSRIAARTGTPFTTASRVMTIDPNAMTAPQERSIPAVRMIRVCPMASTPTTIDCCTTSERLGPVKNRSVCVAK